MLGDGRAVLMGEHLSIKTYDLIFNLKVLEELLFQEVVMVRAALGPMLREYIISEAMHALKYSND